MHDKLSNARGRRADLVAELDRLRSALDAQRADIAAGIRAAAMGDASYAGAARAQDAARVVDLEREIAATEAEIAVVDAALDDLGKQALYESAIAAAAESDAAIEEIETAYEQFVATYNEAARLFNAAVAANARAVEASHLANKRYSNAGLPSAPRPTCRALPVDLDRIFSVITSDTAARARANGGRPEMLEVLP